jgi:Cys-tRNA(Pro) deacylase
MTKIKTHAIRRLDELGIPYRMVLHSRKAKTVEEAAAERGVPESQVIKTLLVRCPDGKHVVALVRGDRRLSLKKLARIVGVKSLKMAPEADVPRITGYRVGAVAPIGLRRADVPTYVDRDILDEPQVSISAGRHDAGIVLATNELLRAVNGALSDITE